MCVCVCVCFIFWLLSYHVVLGAILIGSSCFPALSSVQGERRRLHWRRRRAACRAPSAVQRKVWRVVQRGLPEGKGYQHLNNHKCTESVHVTEFFVDFIFFSWICLLLFLLFCYSCCSGLSPASFSVATPIADARFSMTTVTQKSVCPPSTGGTETTPASSWYDGPNSKHQKNHSH